MKVPISSGFSAKFYLTGITAIIKEKFADVIASGNKGLIMKTIMPELKGKADGKLINQIVAKLAECTSEKE